MTIKLGLTGGIGTGKSTVAKFFSVLNIPIYEADLRAKYLVEHNEILKKTIQELLGVKSYLPDGKYNKIYVADKVFRDADLLIALNGLIHPIVQKDFESWTLLHQNAKIIVKEAALMQKNTHLDKIVVVSSPLDIRINRILKRDPFRSESEVKSILNKQKTEEEYLKLADFVVVNDEKKLLIPQILEIIEILKL